MVTVEEIRAPRGIAPFSFALSAHVGPADEPRSEGRLVLLHDPAGGTGWQGTLRLVAYVDAAEPVAASERRSAEAVWAWLIDGLRRHDARHIAADGTVTSTISTRFGSLRHAGEPDSQATSQLRASWSPAPDSMPAHLRAWCDVLRAAAGVPIAP